MSSQRSRPAYRFRDFRDGCPFNGRESLKGVRTMRNLVISVLVVGLLSLLPLSPRVGPSSGLLPMSISLGQNEAKAYVTYRRARVTTRRVYRRAYRRSYYHY